MSKRKLTRKLYPSEIIGRLDAIAKRWPDGIMLFANSGTLLLVRESDMEVLRDFDIDCDGGSAGTHFEGRKEYLDL